MPLVSPAMSTCTCPNISLSHRLENHHLPVLHQVLDARWLHRPWARGGGSGVTQPSRGPASACSWATGVVGTKGLCLPAPGMAAPCPAGRVLLVTCTESEKSSGSGFLVCLCPDTHLATDNCWWWLGCASRPCTQQDTRTSSWHPLPGPRSASEKLPASLDLACTVRTLGTTTSQIPGF